MYHRAMFSHVLALALVLPFGPGCDATPAGDEEVATAMVVVVEPTGTARVVAEQTLTRAQQREIIARRKAARDGRGTAGASALASAVASTVVGSCLDPTTVLYAEGPYWSDRWVCVYHDGSSDSSALQLPFTPSSYDGSSTNVAIICAGDAGVSGCQLGNADNTALICRFVSSPVLEASGSWTRVLEPGNDPWPCE